ncbi:MAG: hypothetical protein ACO1OT_00965 [Heyndrickxia sp.]
MALAWQEVLASKDYIVNRTSPYKLDICLQRKDGIFTQLVGSQLSDISRGGSRTALHLHKHVCSVMEIADKSGQMIKRGQENNNTLYSDDFKVPFTSEENENEA